MEPLQGPWCRLLQKYSTDVVIAVYDDSLLLGHTFACDLISELEYRDLRARKTQGPSVVVAQVVACILGKDEDKCKAFWDVLELKVMATCTRLRCIVQAARKEYHSINQTPESSPVPPSSHNPQRTPQEETPVTASPGRELSWRRDLLSILQELTDNETQSLRYLLRGYGLPEGRLEEATSRPDLARLVTGALGDEVSVAAMRDLLPILPRNDERVLGLLAPHLVGGKPSSATRHRDTGRGDHDNNDD